MEETIEKERRLRQEVEKLVRKADGDKRVAMETIEEVTKAKTDAEQRLKK